jgi:hypothetical protein
MAICFGLSPDPRNSPLSLRYWTRLTVLGHRGYNTECRSNRACRCIDRQDWREVALSGWVRESRSSYATEHDQLEPKDPVVFECASRNGGALASGGESPFLTRNL